MQRPVSKRQAVVNTQALLTLTVTLKVKGNISDISTNDSEPETTDSGRNADNAALAVIRSYVFGLNQCIWQNENTKSHTDDDHAHNC